jgi:hypothetical protein
MRKHTLTLSNFNQKDISEMGKWIPPYKIPGWPSLATDGEYGTYYLPA